MTEKEFEGLIFGINTNRRFTQDSPVYPEVWMRYFKNRDALKNYRLDLILTPHRKSSAGELLKTLYEKLSKRTERNDNPYRLATTGESVAASLTFEELVGIALPLTNWWQRYLLIKGEMPTEDLKWLKCVAGALCAYQLHKGTQKDKAILVENIAGFEASFNDLFSRPLNEKNEPVLWAVSHNREATISMDESVPATKADAGKRVFEIDGSGIKWAVLDTGIDASHEAFRKTDPKTGKPHTKPFGPASLANSNFTRITASYDFTKFRDLLSGVSSSKVELQEVSKVISGLSGDDADKKLTLKDRNASLRDVEKMLKSGRMLDWDVLAPLLRIPHNQAQYKAPKHNHGTHVAGILAADTKGKETGTPLTGMCPGIELYDIRVLDETGKGDEFNVLAGLQFIRWLNSQKDAPVVHGINLSLSMKHEVASYACGRTPVCVVCERLVADGVVVVAAAGNLGQAIYQTTDGAQDQGFRIVNITDPGNAESVITVGSTHRSNPHTYGVSYFSSKGPTGDGRYKPDLVAPGEKIESCCIDNSTETRDGTSMAAPHVSGAAALLMAKHRELIGNPQKVKKILCQTATDLGREKYFQGAGLVDVLRAIQSV